MPSAPRFRRRDTVYLKSSAGIGRLDSFRVYNSKLLNGKWVYQITISKKPPHQQTIGDSWDKRVFEGDLFYYEDELETLCEAITDCVNALETQIAYVEPVSVSDNCTGTGIADTTVGVDEPRYDVDDIVYFDVSARLGFFMPATITGVYEVGIQQESQRVKYVYKTSVRSSATNDDIYYREDELITLCEAYPKVLSNLNGQLAEMLAKQSSLC